MKRLLPILLLLCGACARAHEDTPLRIDADGTLSGLPKDHSPAKLRLGFAPVEGTRRLTSLSFEMRGARVDLPACALGWINTENAADSQVVASWYHDESVVPYYLELKLFDPGYDAKAWANPGFTLLFDLRTAHLMEMAVDVVHEKARIVQSIPVDLRSRCSEEEVGAFSRPSR